MQEVVLDFSALTPTRPDLSDEQRKARDAEGNTIVIACPGAGKTEVVIQRVEQNTKQNIETLVLVFSRAAAGEVRERCPTANIHTIHSYCHSVVGWKDDYPDLLYRFILHEPKEHFDEVIIDEAQDLTPLQMDVIFSIPKDSLFAVGDPYQAIYIGEWARTYFDAPSLGLRSFEYLSKICKKELTITGSRRSTPEILDILNLIYPRNLKSIVVKELDTTAVITRNHNKLRQCSDLLNALEIPHILYKQRRKDITESRKQIFGDSPKLELLVAHHCKGKQYRNVLIHDWNTFSLEETNLLYTATARAAQNVYFIPSGGIITRFIPQKCYISNWIDYL